MGGSFYVPHGLIEPWSNNGLGYNSMRASLIREMQNLGWEYRDRDSNTMLHMCAPTFFRAIPDRKNVLFTMWEAIELPQVYALNLRNADLIVTPSRYCAQIFRRYVDVPIAVVPLGVDPSMFPYHERSFGQPFRFFWFGACNPRKGWEHVIEVWDTAFRRLGPAYELYLKTNMDDIEVMREGNVILDGRRLDAARILELYHSAHVFLLPHAGEGWGLTLHEAMSTGLPCITTRTGGVLDFADEDTAVFLNWRLANRSWGLEGDSDSRFETVTVWPEPQSLASAMEVVVKDYDKALVMGKRASQRAQSFTWRASAEKLSQ